MREGKNKNGKWRGEMKILTGEFVVFAQIMLLVVGGFHWQG